MPHYSLSIAPTGRAGCKGACKEKIPQGAIRFASIGQGQWDGDVPYYRKLCCVTKKVAENALAVHGGDVSSIPGFSDLDSSQQEEVSDRFDALLNGENAATAGRPR